MSNQAQLTGSGGWHIANHNVPQKIADRSPGQSQLTTVGMAARGGRANVVHIRIRAHEALVTDTLIFQKCLPPPPAPAPIDAT